MTLKALYGRAPSEDEALWQYVGLRDYDRQKFAVVVVDPVVLAKASVNAREMDPRNLDANEKRYVAQMQKNAKEIAVSSTIVVADDEIVDGFHRVYALARAGIRQIRAVDLSQPVE